jgi:iron(III) transport system ATP-binding protein
MGITSVYVTHDQAEAMVISDRVAVMESGNIVQIGPPKEIYELPANRFVADFIGTMNFMPGKVVEVVPDSKEVYVRTEFSEKMLCTMAETGAVKSGETVYASIRPEDVQIFTEPPQAKNNLFRGTIAHKAYLGNFLYLFVTVKDTMVRAQVPHHMPQQEGQELYLLLNPQKCMVLS